MKSALGLNIHFPNSNWVLDPHKLEDAYSTTIALQLHRGLFRYSPQGEVEPDLAERWSESADGKTFVFHLRDTKFSNGVKITSDHVVHSFARLFFLKSLMASDLSYFSGSDGIDANSKLTSFGVKALSESAVEFRLKFPSGLLLKHLATIDTAILLVKNFTTPLTFDEKSAYSGPYRVKGARPDEVAVEKWRKDLKDAANPPSTIRFFKSTESPMKLAKNDQTDSCDHDGLTNEEIKDLTGRGWLPSVTEITTERFVVLDPQKVSPIAREFLFHSAPREQICESQGENGALRPAYGLVPLGIEGALPVPKEKSRPHEKPQTGTLRLHYNRDRKINTNIAKLLKEAWQSAVFNVDLISLSTEEYFDHLFNKKSEAILAGKSVDYFDGYSVLAYFRSTLPGNYFFVADPSVDDSLNFLQGRLSPQQRIEGYHKVQTAILKHHTVIPLTFGTEASGLWSPKLKLVPPHPLGMHTLPFETLELRKP